jgi:hypothetical protein
VSLLSEVRRLATGQCVTNCPLEISRLCVYVLNHSVRMASGHLLHVWQIPSQGIGLLMGKGGSNIKRLSTTVSAEDVVVPCLWSLTTVHSDRTSLAPRTLVS